MAAAAPSASASPHRPIPLLQRLGLDDVLRGIRRPAEPRQPVVVGRGRRTWRSATFSATRSATAGISIARPSTRALLDAVEAAGVTVWRQNRVTSLERANGNWKIGTASPDGDANTACRHARRCLRAPRGGGASRSEFAAAPSIPRSRPSLFWKPMAAPHQLHDATTTDRGGRRRLVVRGAVAQPAARGRLVYRS